MRDPRARKASLIALGRALEGGDYLALVAVHLAAKTHSQWNWATLWWHDRPAEGEFAHGRPAETPRPWMNYLLDSPLDPVASGQAEVSPTFNPWFEGRFPDSGAGGGLSSNCISCHRRASYPPVPFLPVRAGAPDVQGDPAYRPGQLRTDFIWSIARRPKDRIP